MSFESLRARLATLQETTAQLQSLISDLTNTEFEPGSVPLSTDDEDSASGELSAEIGSLLRTGIEDQALLKEEIRYLRPEGGDKERLVEETERVGFELSSCRLGMRKARLEAKKRLEVAQIRERELMLRAYSNPVSPILSASTDDEPKPSGARGATAPAPAHKPSRLTQPNAKSGLSEQDQQTVGASSNVTNALRRTHDLIAAELSRSEFAHQTLSESSAALKQLNESYGSLDTMLQSSRDLLGTLLRSQKSDTWYLQTAMYMLMATGAWLVFRRLLYGPAWWLVWLPIRIVLGVGSSAGSAVMSGSGGLLDEDWGDTTVGGPEAKVPIEGIKEVPTARVGQRAGGKGDDSDPESMVNRVEKLVREADEDGNILEPISDGIRASEDTRPRDEL